MSADPTAVFLTFPPRSLGDGEREIVRDWLAGAEGIAAAYVSERRGDDPAYFRKIVVIEAGSRAPAYLVHCPNGTNVWVVAPQGEREPPRHYASLRAALNAVRPASALPAHLRPAADRLGAGAVADRRGPAISDARGRTIAEMAAALRRPLVVDNAAAAPRRKQS